MFQLRGGGGLAVVLSVVFWLLSTTAAAQSVSVLGTYSPTPMLVGGAAEIDDPIARGWSSVWRVGYQCTDAVTFPTCDRRGALSAGLRAPLGRVSAWTFQAGGGVSAQAHPEGIYAFPYGEATATRWLSTRVGFVGTVRVTRPLDETTGERSTGFSMAGGLKVRLGQ